MDLTRWWRWWAALGWWLRQLCRAKGRQQVVYTPLYRALDERIVLSWYVLRLIWGASYAPAAAAVRQVAAGPNDPHPDRRVTTHLRIAGYAENIDRQARALFVLGGSRGRTFRERHLLIELAYSGMVVHNRPPVWLHQESR